MSAQVWLREIARADLTALNRWRADRSLVDMLGGPFRHVGLDAEERWFQAYLAARDRNVRLTICRNGSDDAIGVVYLLEIDAIARSSEFAIMIGDPQKRSQGVGTAATRLALDYAFNDLNLHRVFLKVLPHNPATRLYERVGFRPEGQLRDAVFKGGRFHDLLLMGLLRTEFPFARD